MAKLVIKEFPVNNKKVREKKDKGKDRMVLMKYEGYKDDVYRRFPFFTSLLVLSTAK